MQQTFNVKGMHCASCSSIISKKIGRLAGVEVCDVNFATDKAKISYDPGIISVEAMNSEINKLGYSLINGGNMQMKHENHEGMDHSEHLGLPQTKEEKLAELKNFRNKVIFSFPLTLIVFVIMVWDILAEFIPRFQKLPIPMQVFNPILFVVASIFLFWVGKIFLEGVVRFKKIPNNG